MTDTQKLKDVLYNLHLTQAKTAALLGMSTQSFNMKLHNKREFTVREIELMIRVLKISNPMEIFFAQFVDFKSTN